MERKVFWKINRRTERRWSLLEMSLRLWKSIWKNTLNHIEPMTKTWKIHVKTIRKMECGSRRPLIQSARNSRRRRNRWRMISNQGSFSSCLLVQQSVFWYCVWMGVKELKRHKTTRAEGKRTKSGWVLFLRNFVFWMLESWQINLHSFSGKEIAEISLSARDEANIRHYYCLIKFWKGKEMGLPGTLKAEVRNCYGDLSPSSPPTLNIWEASPLSL